ncbi:MAG TPA: HAD-IA family hydrolase [Candidatus Acidoferrum sp.]
MATPKFRAIIFDIGRVLVRVDLRRAMDAFSSGLTLSPAELWMAIEKDPRWPDWQEGRLSARDWHLHLTKRLGFTLTFEQFTSAWNRALDPIPIHDDSFFQKLSKRYRLALLSNTDPVHVAHLEATYKFFESFPARARIYSCAVGFSKPNPLIYREALRACKVPAGQTIYIDDVPAFVDAARKLGLTAVQFGSPDQLQKDLRALNIDLD